MHPDLMAALRTLPPTQDQSPAALAQRAEEAHREVAKIDAAPLGPGASMAEKAKRIHRGGEPVPPQISYEVGKLRKSKLAKEFVAAEEAAGIEMPDPITLTALQEMPPPMNKYAIDRLWPDGGNVLLAAQRKAGKSTIVGNLLRTLVDGGPLFEEFHPTARKRVALLDFELSLGLLQEWLTDQCIKNTDDITLFSLNGRARAFNILDDRTRGRWAELLLGCDVLIVDPLRPILHGLGLNEWNETGPLLQAFDALKREAGITEGLIVQHHGHHSERAAGDSNLLGWPDAVWNVTREDVNDPRSFRFFDAYGRDVDVQRGLLSMYDSRRLAFAADASVALGDAIIDRIVAHLTMTGPQKKADLLLAGIAGLNDRMFTTTIRRAVEANRITVETGEKNAKIYSTAPGGDNT